VGAGSDTDGRVAGAGRARAARGAGVSGTTAAVALPRDDALCLDQGAHNNAAAAAAAATGAVQTRAGRGARTGAGASAGGSLATGVSPRAQAGQVSWMPAGPTTVAARNSSMVAPQAQRARRPGSALCRGAPAHAPQRVTIRPSTTRAGARRGSMVAAQRAQRPAAGEQLTGHRW